MTEQDTEAVPDGTARSVCDWARLRDAVTTLGGVSVTKRGYPPILGGVLLRAAAAGGGPSVYATNHATATTVELGDVVAEGALVVGWQQLDAILQGAAKRWSAVELSEMEVTLTQVGERGALLEIGGYAFPLDSWDAGEYPIVPDTTKPLAVVAGDDFARAVDGVWRAASTEEEVPELTCVKLDFEGCDGTDGCEDGVGGRIRLLASDTYRVAAASLRASSVMQPWRAGEGVLVSAKALAALAPLFAGQEVVIGAAVDPKAPNVTIALSFTGGGVTVWVTTTEESERRRLRRAVKVLRSDLASASLRADVLLAEVKRAIGTGKASGAKRQYVQLAFGEDGIDVAAHLLDTDRQPSAERVAAKVTGLDVSLTLRFDAAMVVDGLVPFGKEEVTIHPAEAPRGTAIVHAGEQVGPDSRLVQVLAPRRGR
jgi:hypothetical protein